MTQTPATVPASPKDMANAIRALAMDAVQAANSGHPGAPMGMADMAVALWKRHLKHNPVNPHWADRDRFVLSNGHGSMLIYALLHLSGYDLPMSELKNFRQLHSKTAGHPEFGITPGVETTTGPLGQGVTNAVGMALAEKLLAAEFNRTGHTIVNHHTYVFLGDGCLMEGISHEACALAGAWKLGKLIALYDDNGISIDGKVEPWFGDDNQARFRSYGWNVIGPIDGHDIDAVDKAIAQAKKSADKPSLIICKTHIGKGSPNRANTAKAHGEPLGASEIALTREAIGWPHQPFDIPKAVYEAWNGVARGTAQELDWDTAFAGYRQKHPKLAAEFLRRMQGDLPAHFDTLVQEALKTTCAKAETVATRKASQLALEAFTAALPELIGGSADLTGSNLTNTSFTTALRFHADGSVVLPPRQLDREVQQEKNNAALGKEDETPSAPTPLPEVEASVDAPLSARFHINYGVREFGMAAIMNGIALHGGYVPYGGTFLTFSDYSRNAIRMAALMKQRVIHVFTHDSIGLGEDGPTHQSVEHAASLRLIPHLDVWRPGDTAETLVAWACALQSRNRPSALLLSRQNVAYAPKAASGKALHSAIAKGAYVLREPAGGKKPQLVLLATGSELPLAVQAQEVLAKEHRIAARVVSMPSNSVFDRQSPAYKTSVLPADVPRIAIEMGSTDGWWKYGVSAVVGIDTYGESAPAPVLFQHFGFTVENVVNVARSVLR